MKSERQISNVLASSVDARRIRQQVELLKASAKSLERQVDSEIDDVMRDAQLPIEDEMIRIFEEQEDELMRNLETFRVMNYVNNVDHYAGEKKIYEGGTRASPFLTADSLLDFARWSGETASRLAGYVRGTMRKGWCMGLALIGKKCESEILEQFVQEAIAVLTPLNERITETSKREIERIVLDALNDGKSIEEIKREFREMFANWRVVRPHGVSVFNVTYPFNDALFRSYKANGIPFKMWVNQEMIGNTQGELRQTHDAAGGQIVSINERFIVGNAQLLYPGDLTQIASNPEELHGCRCMVKPVLDPDEEF